MVAAYRVFKILDTDEFVKDTGTNLDEVKGEIIFDKVNFSYEVNNPIIKNLSIEIKAGERVAIVGPTGSGKSTIIKLILRFFEINSGKIYIDGKSIEKFSLKNLRSQISLVSQDIFLFADSIYNNISLFKKNISKDKIENAANEIGILEFINKLPGGFNYNVKERGVMLSEGQRQLISFLRAYVSNPKILILDEATSSIDSKTEQLIQYATNKIIEGKTSIIIAHRLSTILNADKIIYLDNGEIKEFGSHDELIKIENGLYKKLFEYQFQDSKELEQVI
jgi:subfamily B ATP-binding cassette protein MsbA